MTAWEIHETTTCELHIRRPHDPANVPYGRIVTYGVRRLDRVYGGHDLAAVIMPVYVRRKTGRWAVDDNAEMECDAVPNRALAEVVLKAVQAT